jgi:hypothetical protein
MTTGQISSYQITKWLNGKWSNGRWSNGKWSNGRWSNGKWSNGRWFCSGMGKIGNIGYLDIKNDPIGFFRQYINIDNYHIGFLIMLPSEIRIVEKKLIQFDTKLHLFEVSQNNIIAYFSSCFVLNFCTQNQFIKLINLYSKQYKTKYFLIKREQN